MGHTCHTPLAMMVASDVREIDFALLSVTVLISARQMLWSDVITKYNTEAPKPQQSQST